MKTFFAIFFAATASALTSEAQSEAEAKCKYKFILSFMIILTRFLGAVESEANSAAGCYCDLFRKY